MTEQYLIAMDLDGTLFGTNHQLSSRTIDCLNAVAQRGHRLVAITGRSAFTAVDRLVETPSTMRLVCSNGAYEFDRQQNRMVWTSVVPAALAVTIHRQILAHIPGVSFGWESACGLNFDDQFIEQAGGAHTLEQGGRKESLGQSDVLKICVRTVELARDELQDRLQNLLSGLAEVSTSGAPFVELTASGIDKGSALSRIADNLNVSAAHTIAFGDNINDLPMLTWAGEAVAMGNAVEAVRSIADTQTASNAEDGVATLLENRFVHGDPV